MITSDFGGKESCDAKNLNESKRDEVNREQILEREANDIAF